MCSGRQPRHGYSTAISQLPSLALFIQCMYRTRGVHCPRTRGRACTTDSEFVTRCPSSLDCSVCVVVRTPGLLLMPSHEGHLKIAIAELQLLAIGNVGTAV